MAGGAGVSRGARLWHALGRCGVMEKEQAAAAVRAFLAALDVDVSARGMERTPERVAIVFAC